MSLILNRRDLDFLLYDFLESDHLHHYPRFAGQGRETYDQIIDLAFTLAEAQFQPHAALVDVDEPRFDGERVSMPAEVKQALDAYVEAGFMGAGFDEELGGLQLPCTLVQAIAALFYAANVSTATYPLLTIGAANLLAAYGDETQRRLYLEPLVAGRYFGTMCLSEPHAGSSLADIRTKAVPQADGSYRLFGSKMWISGGEHELSENIVHLVLAKIEGAPPGVKGISLFAVPRLLVAGDGSLGARNDVRLAGLNHKMGWRGIVNTVLNFGEDEGAIGSLVGEPHRGLAYMFHMMNEARIACGVAAVALSYTGYLHSLDYAKTRRQGRLPGEKDPTTPMVPLTEHADVKRMLLQQKAYAEGGLALGLYSASLVDLQDQGTAEESLKARRLLDILTPIVKTWPAVYGLKANEIAIQVLGGAGYTRDYPLERFYRENRLNAIHEGTTGIQAGDLLGRKVRQEEGAAFDALCDAISADLDPLTKGLSVETEDLAAALGICRQVTHDLVAAAAQVGEVRYLANATLYLDAIGHIVVAWLWLRQAQIASRLLAEGPGEEETAFLQGKLAACRYFFRYELPAARTTLALVAQIDDTCASLDPAVL
ncbi:MAG: acyl-CoA dehydrogenase [Pseudomonadota bacterium]